MEIKGLSHKVFLERLISAAKNKFKYHAGKTRGLQVDIAKAIGTKNPTVRRWLRGGSFPEVEHLYNLHRVLGVSVDYLLGIEGEEKLSLETPPSPFLELTDLVGVVEAGLETEDFISFPIQAFGSTTQASGQLLGQVVIHKRVFGRRKNLAAVQLNGGKEIKVVIVGK